MSRRIRVYGSELVHQLAVHETADTRLGRTVCGIRFAWGAIRDPRWQADYCGKCWL